MVFSYQKPYDTNNYFLFVNPLINHIRQPLESKGMSLFLKKYTYHCNHEANREKKRQLLTYKNRKKLQEIATSRTQHVFRQDIKARDNPKPFRPRLIPNKWFAVLYTNKLISYHAQIIYFGSLS